MSQPTRVAAGTPVGRLLRASKINYVLEGAELAHAQQMLGFPSSRGFAARAGRALVRNDTGEALDRFSVLGITDILVDPETNEDEFKAHFGFVGEKPDADRDGPGRFAITQAPAADGELVLCVLSGLTVAYIDKDEDTTYTEAALVTDDAEKLAGMTGGGTVVLWHAAGTGKQLCVLNVGAGGAACPEVHEFSMLGGPPSSGSVVWSYTIDDDTQDVTLNWDDTAAEVETAFETAFSGISLDVTASGGPLPSVAVYVEFSNDNDVTFPPVQGTTTLNNSAAPLIRRNSPM